MKIFRIPHIVMSAFPNIIWRQPRSNSPCVYLTFDDGPHPHFTEKIMDILQEQGAGATFFMLGKMALKYPSLVRAVCDRGHTVALHSFEHRRLFFQSSNYFLQQLKLSKEIVEQIIEQPVHLFRPPHGIFRPGLIRACRSLNLRMALWSVLTYDYDLNVTDRTILHLVQSDVKNGDIIVFHDGHCNSRRTVEILVQVISILKDKDFELIPLKILPHLLVVDEDVVHF